MHAVSKVIMHENYVAATKENDIGLIKVTDELKIFFILSNGSYS